jgi:hypothetical protein
MRYRYTCGLVVGSLLFGAACTGGGQSDDDASNSSSKPAAVTSASPSTSATQLQTVASPSISASPVVKCKVAGTGEQRLPDQRCTPGTDNLKVQQDSIRTTICVSGWADKQRKAVSESWFSQHKLKSIQEYGAYAGSSPSAYEYDHKVPISLGGAVQDERNLWAEQGATPNPKDAVEAKVLAAVRDGRMTLAEARRGFQKDWRKIVVPAKNASKKTSGCTTSVKKKAVHHTSSAPKSVYYKNCTAVRAAGAAPLYRGQPGYSSHLDRDGDGVACES